MRRLRLSKLQCLKSNFNAALAACSFMTISQPFLCQWLCIKICFQVEVCHETFSSNRDHRAMFRSPFCVWYLDMRWTLQRSRPRCKDVQHILPWHVRPTSRLGVKSCEWFSTHSHFLALESTSCSIVCLSRLKPTRHLYDAGTVSACCQSEPCTSRWDVRGCDQMSITARMEMRAGCGHCIKTANRHEHVSDVCRDGCKSLRIKMCVLVLLGAQSEMFTAGTNSWTQDVDWHKGRKQTEMQKKKKSVHFNSCNLD